MTGRKVKRAGGANAASGEAPQPMAELMGCTCQRLRKATRRVTQIYEGFLAPVGLTSPQFGLLANLAARDDVSMNELAERLVTDPTTLNRNLKPLEKAGYLKIDSGSDDRRRRRIALTERGRQTFERAIPLWRQAQQHLEAVLGRKDLEALNDALSRSLRSLTRQ
ncbi:MAG: winged helix-turn-helix transcriptional regulator [Proteobacteria bacterium]|nr:winged helix-turn-helix transcriptional regulator [Pseudomonadota bacterium]MBI3499307.1 winged helix-turn-helix transcriptional regulator [Pseudomonadota bacterium]